MAGFKRHVFVCENLRDPSDPRGSCKLRNSEAILKTLKGGAKAAGLKGTVRVNSAGCLDHCEHGPVVVIYPEAVWYHVPTEEDAQEILDKHVIGGEVVERLKID
jgi:(2Fe-2S) ferredoxin